MPPERAPDAAPPAPASPPSPRDRLALALDVDDPVAALRLARRLRPWFAVAKVGLELFTAAGPDVVVAAAALGYRVFLDLKLHDIPTTVGRASRVAGALGVDLFTVHAAGGLAMVRAAVDGLREGASGVGAQAPVALGVTVLTSEDHADPAVVAARVAVALEGGCGGLVCAAPDLGSVRPRAPHALLVVPGTRPAASPTHDQARVATPTAALAAGADLLVVGRAVTAAADPEAAAARFLDDPVTGRRG